FNDLCKKQGGTKGGTVFFNGRGHGNLREEMAFQTQHEIESLPTGGWGYMYFPKNVRLARTLPKPYMGMTARFHKSWADFGGLKPYPALEYETSQMIAHGAKCSIGDQLHPRGTLDRGAYENIGKAYARVAAREPWLTDAKVLTQIAVYQPAERKVGQGSKPPVGASEGAVRMLTQLKHQFDLVDPQADFSGYELLILPDNTVLDEALLKRVKAFLKQGGKLLASGTSGLDESATHTLLPELGVAAHGMSEYQTTYIRFSRELSTDVPPSDHVMYERGVRVTAKAGAAGGATLAKVVEPYFDRSWKHFSSHFQTPADRVSRFAAAVQRGNVGYISYPIFTAHALHGNAPYRLLVRNLLERLLPEPLLRVKGPTSTETSVQRQGKRTIVHLLQYAPERRTERLDLIEDIVPIFDVPLSLKWNAPRAPRKVYMAPDETPVAFEYLAGRVNLRVPEVRGHAMVVFE
ncbi:MAG: beta-galactosidase trimerization domain-containing protein, partial [Tepidisphaeraceae bacterium]